MTAENSITYALIAFMAVSVLKDLVGYLKNRPNGSGNKNTTTVTSNTGNGASLLSAFHIEKTLDRFSDASEKVVETLEKLLLESREHSILLKDIHSKPGCKGK